MKHNPAALLAPTVLLALHLNGICACRRLVGETVFKERNYSWP
jgi:hypothetical protein